MKFATWRKLWLALATSQFELGLPGITSEMLLQMKDKLYDINFDVANAYECKFRHDVMGHVHAYGDVAPLAMPILHLGATSCYVGDNADIIIMKQGLLLLKDKLVKVLHVLSSFASRYASLPTLGFTHYQPAQLTTVGKRCTLWMQDLLLDYDRICHEIDKLVLRGVKGTTGTQASFLELFDGDHDKVKKLNELVCTKMGFGIDPNTGGKVKSIPVSGQTYTRKLDYYVLSVLSGIAQSSYKMCGDVRLLANLKEVEEPFEDDQIGSSAMAYKRNPMRSERACSLSRYVMSLPINAANTHANQWFERTLDDSAIRRIVMPEAFLAVDVILNLLLNIGDGMVVWEKVVEKHVREELPFMATEVIIMECEVFCCCFVLHCPCDIVCRIHILIHHNLVFILPFPTGVKAGGDRQEIHEAIRVHSMAAGALVKGEGKSNDLLERIASDPLFKAVHDKLDTLIDPRLFVGRAVEQTTEFLAEEIMPILEKEKEALGKEIVDGVNV